MKETCKYRRRGPGQAEPKGFDRAPTPDDDGDDREAEGFGRSLFDHFRTTSASPAKQDGGRKRPRDEGDRAAAVVSAKKSGGDDRATTARSA